MKNDIKKIILGMILAIIACLAYGKYLAPSLNDLWDKNEYYGFLIILGSILLFRYIVYPISISIINLFLKEKK